MKALITALMAAAVMVSSMGCARSPSFHAPEPTPPAAPTNHFRLSVNNGNWNQAAVYLLQSSGSRKVRVATVPGNTSTKSFLVRFDPARDVYFLIDLIAGGKPLVVGPHFITQRDRVELRIGIGRSTTHIMVYE